jgi:hypothetical protein
VLSLAATRPLAAEFVRLYDIIKFQLEKDREPELADTILLNWRRDSRGCNLFWKSGKQSAGRFHRFLPGTSLITMVTIYLAGAVLQPVKDKTF